MNQALARIYSEPKDPGSLGGVNRLFKSAKEQHHLPVSKEQVTEFLKSQDTYTLHRPARRHYSRNPTIVGGIDKQWQADLADMSSLAKDNDGFRYLLTVVDCFSKFGWAIPIRRKDSAALVEAFTFLFKSRKPLKLQTDKGKEFLNAPVLELLKKLGIEHFVTQNETKAAMVERFNRTLKNRMYAYFTSDNTNRYLDALPDLLDSYNHSTHRTIGMRPADVRIKHEPKLWHRMYEDVLSKRPVLTKSSRVGDSVRISKSKTVFDKGYRPNWTGEVFKLSEIVSRPNRKVYKLKDRLDEDIAGTFYSDEIQRVVKTDKDLFVIESVIKRRTRKGIKEVLVKWKDFPNKFNSWVKEKEITNVGGAE